MPKSTLAEELMKESVEVAAAIISHEGKYLIAQRPAEGHLSGKWEFPGGKFKSGETAEQCVVREVREELGVEVGVWSLFQIIEHEYPERRVKIHFFNCHLLSNPSDIQTPLQIRWVSLDELPFFDFAEASRPVVQALFTALEL